MSSPLFSVVLPTRNRAPQLTEAIGSVVRQTVQSWELIVVDDHSDEPVAVPDDPRIRTVRLTSPAGPASARNAGVAAARGLYVAFLDDDDLYTADRLEIALEGLARAPIATCWMRFVDRPPANNVTLEGDVSDTILDQSTPSVGATALRRSAFIPFDSRWQGVEDVEWWLRIAATSPMTTVPRVGYLFRRWRDVSEAPRRAQIEGRVAENLELLVEYDGYFRDHPRAAAFRLRRVGLMCMELGDRRGACSAFLRSLRCRPTASTTWHLMRSVVPVRRPGHTGQNPP